jgi:four helix bundle protein
MSGRIKNHKDLIAWQKGIELVTDIYQLTNSFPKEEFYGLTNQMRRAAVSIPSNIAEGAARNSRKEYVQFLHISLGSLAELETQLIISSNLKFSSEVETFIEKIKKIRRLVNGLIFKLKEA